MKAAGLNPLPPVTGQDAELAAIQRVLINEQYMTVYKAIRPEAEVAAELAFALCQGQTLPDTRFNSRVNNARIEVPSILLQPIAVTRDNIKSTVVADQFWSIAQICTAEFTAACAAVGLQ
jgi:D-xylose transport system substrate-binding protein